MKSWRSTRAGSSDASAGEKAWLDASNLILSAGHESVYEVVGAAIQNPEKAKVFELVVQTLSKMSPAQFVYFDTEDSRTALSMVSRVLQEASPSEQSTNNGLAAGLALMLLWRLAFRKVFSEMLHSNTPKAKRQREQRCKKETKRLIKAQCQSASDQACKVWLPLEEGNFSSSQDSSAAMVDSQDSIALSDNLVFFRVNAVVHRNQVMPHSLLYSLETKYKIRKR
jgi:hypothetical protein